MTRLLFGLGYLGSALAASFLERGEHVVALDNGFATDLAVAERMAAASAGRLTVLRGDLRREEDVVAAFDAAGQPESVYLLAAQASAHPEAAPATYTEDTNLRGARHVLDVALRFGKPRIVFGSSFHVYGPGLQGAVDETRPYGAFRDLTHLSKLYVEKLGEWYALQHGLPFISLRLGVVYGVGPIMKRDLRFVTVPHAFCLRALAGEPLRVHTSGLLPAAFVHLEDTVCALELVANAPLSAAYVPLNVADEVRSALDVARLVMDVARMAGAEPILEVDDASSATLEGAGAPAPFAVTSGLTTLGWQPRGTLRAALPAIWAHYRGAQA